MRALTHRSLSLRPLLERAGLPRIRFHCLQYTFATLLLSHWMLPKIVQEPWQAEARKVRTQRPFWLKLGSVLFGVRVSQARRNEPRSSVSACGPPR